jgi:uncharacterized protein YndB with AHSA1/START domain
MSPDFQHYRSFTFKAGGAAVTRASPEAVWAVVSRIGGDNRYYALNALWTMREWMDALVGGPGMRRGRPAAERLQPGDRIDSWEVLTAEPGRRLALIFGMKAPGRGVLEFVIAAMGGGTRLTATAYWEPDGIAGVLYWRAMQPAHIVLFRRLTAEICHRAEAAPRADDDARRNGRLNSKSSAGG